MSNIVYILGAGASYGCLPTIEEFNNDDRKKLFLKDHKQNIRNKYSVGHTKKLMAQPGYPSNEILKEYESDLDWLFNEVATAHMSIDTFAKRMHLIKDKNFAEKRTHRFKTILTTYFLLLQITKAPNKRYDSFFASILEDTADNLPSNISIVSWNYDLQWEIAYTWYSLKNDVLASRELLNVHSKGDGKKVQNGNKFKILNVNGTCLWQDTVNDKICDVLSGFSQNTLDPWDEKIFEKIMMRYWDLKKNSPNVKNRLSFSWEEESGKQDPVITMALNAIAQAEVLVVIGYSFPTFNRKIDKLLLSHLKSKDTKIYIQCKDDNDRVKERLLTLLPSGFKLHEKKVKKNDGVESQFELVDDVSNFIIPPEFD